MGPEASAFSPAAPAAPAATAVPPSTSTPHPSVQPPSVDDLFSVFGLPPLDSAGPRTGDLRNHKTGVSPMTDTARRGFVKMPPPASIDAPKLDKPCPPPQAMPNIEALSFQKPSFPGRPTSYNNRPFQQTLAPRPVPSAGVAPTGPMCQLPGLPLRPAASTGERQTNKQSPGQCVEPSLTPISVPRFEAMTDLLSKLDTKYTQAAPDLSTLEKLVDAKVNAMPKTDPKRKILMQQFLDLKHAHSQVQIGALQMRANLVAEAREERKQKAAAASGNDRMELE